MALASMRSSTSAISDPQRVSSPAGGLARVAAVLWMGSLWTVAGVVPLLFWRLPQAVAGGLAGDLFVAGQGLGLILGGIVAGAVPAGRWRRLARIAWGLDGVFALLILPVMAMLRATPHFGPASPSWGPFMALHVVSTSVYLAEGVLGLMVVARAL